MTDMRTEALDDHQRVLRARAARQAVPVPESTAAPLSAVYGPLTTDLDELPTYPCDICGDHVQAGEKFVVTDNGLTVEHTACTRAWLGRSFGREGLS